MKWTDKNESSLLPQLHVKILSFCHLKTAGGRLQLNTHAPYVSMWLCMK